MLNIFTRVSSPSALLLSFIFLINFESGAIKFATVFADFQIIRILTIVLHIPNQFSGKSNTSIAKYMPIKKVDVFLFLYDFPLI